MKILLFILVVTGNVVQIVASDVDSSSTPPPRSYWMAGLYPFSAFNYTLKPEIEYRTSGSFGYMFSPEINYSQNLSRADDFFINSNKDNLSFLGFGGVLTLKYYTSDSFAISPVSPVTNTNYYIYGSTEYHRISLDYPSKSWIKYNDNGNDYYRLEQIQQQNTINQYGASIGLGMLVTIGSQVFCDLYTGYTAIISKQNPTFTENEPYKDNLFSVSKLTFTVGCKVGLIFK